MFPSRPGQNPDAPNPLEALLTRLRRPALLAHRGASLDAPENSLAALKLAHEQGADGVEFDVQACAGGELVVFHDRTLARVTGKVGEVKDFDLARLKQLELRPLDLPEQYPAHSHRDAASREPQRIPTLEEWLAHSPAGFFLNMEIKAPTARDASIAQAALAAVEKRGKERETIVSSFHPAALFHAQKQNPAIPRALLLNANTRWRLILTASLRAKPSAIHVDHRLITPNRVKRWKRLGFRVLAWTVDDEDLAKTCLDAGVDGLISNAPERLQGMVGRYSW